MKNLTRKMFSLGELKFSLLLLLSVAVCAVTFYIDETVNPDEQFWLSFAYYGSFTLAALWCGANYVAHIRMNSLYLKQNDIDSYVEQLAMSKEDKLELRNYLEDYAADLEQNGKTKKEAVDEAINQFRVREFLTMSKHTKPFESHGHHYLLGYALLSLIAAIALAVLGRIVIAFSLEMFVATTVLTVYGICLAALFAFYKILDLVIYRKLKNFFLK